jgi:hypothetical protein
MQDKEEVYDIINVNKNNNYIGNNLLLHNSAAEWAKRENRELKKKLAQIRTKHLLFILCFPLKIYKLEKTYLESFTNYWCLSGDTKINIMDNEGMIRNVPISELRWKTDFKVLSYDIKNKIYEYKKCGEVIKTKKDVQVYEMELENGLKIKATDEHQFLTQRGYVKLKDLKDDDEIEVKAKECLYCKKQFIPSREMLIKIKRITKLKKKEDVFDILDVSNNNNFIANSMVVHNCDLFARGHGAIFVKDKNPTMDSWRMKEFANIGSYTEFTSTAKIKDALKKHPNFWTLIKFPKPPDWLYARYLNVREKNVYDDDNVMNNVSKEDIHNALLVLSLRDIMTNDTTFTMNRIILHVRNEHDITITKSMIQSAIQDAEQLVSRVKELSYSIQ